MKHFIYALCAATLGLMGTSSQAATFSSGFEMGADVASISFSPTDANGLGWSASNTDGERIRTTGAKPAAEGNFYASLLQNSGAYDGSALGIGNFGFTGFDRIYTTFSVLANTVYEVSFMHAGDDRFGYTADRSVVELVNADSNTTLALNTYVTPGLFNWQQVTFSFNSGAATSIGLAFTVMGQGNTSGVFDDIKVSAAIGAIPLPGGAVLLLSSLGLLTVRRKRNTA